MTTVMDAKWGNKVITGEEKAIKPGLAAFSNSAMAIEMLHTHFLNDRNIAIHCDVDMDGIGSGYIFGRFANTQTNANQTYIINKDKVHGIQQKHADYFKDKAIDLLVIVDSSSNELDIIKQFNCDVLVIDHHEINHNELYGNTNDGVHKYLIINNTLDNSDIDAIKCLLNKNNTDTPVNIDRYKGDDRMSCGLVVYELLRLYSIAYNTGNILENMRLYQWAGVTLFTDAIILNTPRNQWYIENTIHSMETETTLKQLLEELNPYKVALDKSVINYTIAPVINKAIRAGHSGDALNTIIFNPKNIQDIVKYKEEQENAIKVGILGARASSSYVIRDLSNTDIHKNYNGVIASRLSGDFSKNAIVYSVYDGIADGSFRGRLPGIDYRKFIDEFDDTTWAQGHKTAFGFKFPIGKLDTIMSQLTSIESTISNQYLLTAGVINNQSPGVFVIDDIEEFKKQGGIWKLGIGNSKVSTDEQILITVSTSDASLVEQRGKLYIYNVLGIQCKAFDIISKPVINIYVEYSRQIDCYIK